MTPEEKLEKIAEQNLKKTRRYEERRIAAGDKKISTFISAETFDFIEARKAAGLSYGQVIDELVTCRQAGKEGN